MKKGCVMSLCCVECHKRYDIKDSELDDYNIYWTMTGGKLSFKPNLLCPKCSKKWARKVS